MTVAGDVGQRSSRPLRFATMCAVLIPLLPLRGVIVPPDNQGYLELIEQAGTVNNGSGSSAKEYVGVFYAAIDNFVAYGIYTNAIFIIYIYVATLAIRTLSAYAIAVVVSLPMFIHFDYVSKEGILGSIALLCVGVSFLFGKRAGHFSLFSSLIIFAIFVRPYYAIPLLGTAIFSVLGFRRGSWVALAGFVLVLFVYSSPLEVLEGQRQRMYEASVYSFGTRTVYPNVHFTEYASIQLQIVANYIVVLLETFFPILWTWNLKDLYAQVFMVAVLALIVGAIRCGDRTTTAFGILLIATIPFFSPDLGTSMRHIGAAAMFLHVGISVQRHFDRVRIPFNPLQLRPIYEIERK